MLPITEKDSSVLWKAAKAWLPMDQKSLPADFLVALEQLYTVVEAGHVCINVRPVDEKAWRATGWVANPGESTPFILEDGRLYLARYWHYENTIAEKLKRLANDSIVPHDMDILAEDLNALFDPDPEDRQRLAALLAQFSRLTLISGGPGTGKTTTVVRLLALLQMEAQRQTDHQPLRILLAAPTGKAAQRLSESIRKARDALKITDEVKACIPDAAQTLHRLLGAQGDTGRFRYQANSPLPCDVLLVDEASMIDLGMMHALLSALPEHARLVLLGDRNQLASVEAGSVLGDICVVDCMSASLQKRLSHFGIPQLNSKSRHALSDCSVGLIKSYRFKADSMVKALADAALESNGEAFNAVLQQQGALVEKPHLQTFLQKQYQDFFTTVTAEDCTPGKAFADFSRFRVLCAHRQGEWGIEGINAMMDKDDAWRKIRPVIIRRNDYALRLFNGDIGLCLKTDNGYQVFFEDGPDTYRAFALGRLPAHEPAWAMTVHQSQGSEFDRILMVMPPSISPVLDKPLIYTAVTRAKVFVYVCDDSGVIPEALQKLPERVSGLPEKLKK